MFFNSKSLFGTFLLSFYLCALVSNASPVDLISRQEAQCDPNNVSVVTVTATVTATGSAATSTEGNNGGNGGNNNNAGGGGAAGDNANAGGNAGNNNNGGNTGNNNGGNNGNNGGNGNNNGGNNGNNNGNGGNNGNNNGGNNGNNNGGNGGDDGSQTSLTLDPAVIAPGFANNGQDVPTAGQVASLTSTNNFINFCLLTPNLPITNGQQIPTGSCNPAPIGVIPSTDNMPSAKFAFPANFGAVQANKAFTIQLAVKNFVTGNFVNAQKNYFAAPQQLQNGQIIGHSHVVIEQIQSLKQTTATDPKVFAFFKGLNEAAQNGVLSTDVSDGLPVGAYRLCSINSSANHQPVIVPVAQHGSLDDCVYFEATDNGQPSVGR